MLNTIPMFLQHVPVLRNQRITVMGLGLFGGGVGITRFLSEAGARVTVTDLRTEKDLSESLQTLTGQPVTFHLGGHREQDFTETDLVVVNPSVPEDSPYLKLAAERGVPLETEMNLFFKLCPARILGVTGSNGKTTTTALIGEVLKRTSVRPWVGGNIGRSLLPDVHRMSPDDWAVLEISSFQLDHLAHLRRSPHVSVVMNLSPNHLDRHKTMDRYVEAKKHIVRYQTPSDWMVLNADDAVVSVFASASSGRAAFFSLKSPGHQALGARDQITLRLTGMEFRLDVARRKIPGWFNLQNMTAATLACAIATGTEGSRWQEACQEVLTTFPGVEHRLEFVGEFRGIRYYNDSIATNPDSTIAALDTLSGPIVLIAGGYDKNLPFDRLSSAIAAGKVKGVVLLGQTAPKLEEFIRKETNKVRIEKVPTLTDAVAASMALAVPGDTVLLSPACASFDMFRNYVDRGRQFKKDVLNLHSSS